jgi:NAD(P)-dependent dehydrogenase (short-subunit alcohol dehydrogenase family)
MNMDNLEHKTAFVTGGASGIGLGIVQACLGAGMRVVIADISDRHLDEVRSQYAGNGNVHIMQLDVTDRAAMKAAAQQSVDHFGKVHLLVNNAGVGVLGPIEKAGYDDWDWAMGVNLGGVFNGIHEFLPRLLEHGEGGHIVSTASKAALVPLPNCSFYCAAKAALVGLSESLRGELAPKGIGVSVFCPGPVRSNIQEVGKLRPEQYKGDSGFTEFEQAMLARESSPLWMSKEEVGQRVLQGIRENRLFILTHPEFKAGLQQRFDYILDEFPQEEINQERAAAISFLTSNSIYQH